MTTFETPYKFMENLPRTEQAVLDYLKQHAISQSSISPTTIVYIIDTRTATTLAYHTNHPDLPESKLEIEVNQRIISRLDFPKITENK